MPFNICEEGATVARALQVSGFAFLVSLFDLSKRAIRCSLLADLAFSRLINPVLL